MKKNDNIGGKYRKSCKSRSGFCSSLALVEVPTKELRLLLDLSKIAHVLWTRVKSIMTSIGIRHAPHVIVETLATLGLNAENDIR